MLLSVLVLPSWLAWVDVFCFYCFTNLTYYSEKHKIIGCVSTAAKRRLAFELRITLWSSDDPGQICVHIGPEPIPEPIDLLMDNIFLLLPMHRYTAGTN